MNQYKVTYRTTRGNIDTMIVSASNEQSARFIFSSRYDGYVLDVVAVN